MEEKLPASIVAVKQNPHWRYWVARARWYNSKNGLPENEVPFWVKTYFPLKDIIPVPAKQGGDKDKGSRKERDKGG